MAPWTPIAAYKQGKVLSIAYNRLLGTSSYRVETRTGASVPATVGQRLFDYSPRLGGQQEQHMGKVKGFELTTSDVKLRTSSHRVGAQTGTGVSATLE